MLIHKDLMIVVIRPHAPAEEVEQVIREITELGYTPSPIRGEFQTVVAAIGDKSATSWPAANRGRREP